MPADLTITGCNEGTWNPFPGPSLTPYWTFVLGTGKHSYSHASHSGLRHAHSGTTRLVTMSGTTSVHRQYSSPPNQGKRLRRHAKRENQGRRFAGSAYS